MPFHAEKVFFLECAFASIKNPNLLLSKYINAYLLIHLSHWLAGRYRFIGEAEKASETLSVINVNVTTDCSLITHAVTREEDQSTQ